MVSSRHKRAAADDGAEGESPRPTSNSDRETKKSKPGGPQRKKTASDGAEKGNTPKPKQSAAADRSQGAPPTKQSKHAMFIDPVDEQASDSQSPQTEAAAEQSAEVQKEQQAREKLFAEITDEYYDIVEELPLELDRNFTLIRDMDVTVQECSQEIHEDLNEYLQIAHHINRASRSNAQVERFPGPKSATPSPAQRELDDNAHPTASASFPISTPSLPPNCGTLPPEFVHALWGDIARRMSRAQTLGRDKLSLAESINVGLDRHLRRIDAELEKYLDLENLDETGQKGVPVDESNKDVQSGAPPPINGPAPEVPFSFATPKCRPAPKKSPVTQQYKSIEKSAKKSVDATSPPDHPIRSPEPSLTMSKQQALESIISPNSQNPVGGYGLRSPHQAGLLPVSKTPGAISPPMQNVANLSARKPSIIKLTGIFADPPSSIGTLHVGPQCISPTTLSARLSHAAHLSDPIRQPETSPSLLTCSQSGRDFPAVDVRKSSPVLRERRVTSGSIEKTPKRTPSGSHRKKVQEEPEAAPVHGDADLASQAEDDNIYCYCQMRSYGPMVACDNDKCEGGEWFHIGCTDLAELPGDSEWYCKICVKKLEGKKAPNKKLNASKDKRQKEAEKR